MFTFLMVVQILAVIVLFTQLLYISYQRPSRMQTELILLVTSTIIMLVGYFVEILGENMETSLIGCSFSYVGKPFALLTSLLFILDFCGVRIKNWLISVMAVYCAFFTALVFTNEYHHLYYSFVEFNPDHIYSPLILGHGPLYFLNMVNIIGTFGVSIFFIIREYHKNKNQLIRAQLRYLFGMIGSCAVGYLIYVAGITNGYDTTMIGSVVGSLFLIFLFNRHQLFDSLTLAKDQALDESKNGLIVLNEAEKVVYTNALLDRLLENTFTLEELDSFPEGTNIVQKNGYVYEIIKRLLINKKHVFGKTIEITDITAQYNYSVELEHEVESRTKKIKNIQRSIISSFAGIVEARDNSTGEHINRITAYVKAITEELLKEGKFSSQLDEASAECLIDIASMHDIGKIVIPDCILLKPGKLTPEEFDVIKTHTTEGARLIKECFAGVERPEYVEMAETVARSHHEKWNGTGYPEKLAGEEIPLPARIVAVADVYDALRSVRCYKLPMSAEEARSIILEGKGAHFDPDVVDAFMNIVDQVEVAN